MTALWTLDELENALGVAPISGRDRAINGVSIDSRTTHVGDIFIALKGDPGPKFHTSFRSTGDGHNFVKQAEEKGAAVVIVDHKVDVNIPQFVVKDTLEAMWNLALAARTRSTAKVVAVTGSCGKTSTKEFLAAGFAELGETHASVGSYNNFWGVPLSMARMPKTTEFAVFEIGMNHEGEIAPLAKLVQPHVSMVTNVRPVHLEYFENLDGIRREKLSIAQGLTTNGILVVPEDLQVNDLIKSNLTTFGIEHGDLHTTQITEGATWQITTNSGINLSLTPGGMHRVSNALATIAAAQALKVNAQKFANGLAKVKVGAGRGTTTTVNGITIIDDSFNANPASVTMALDTLSRATAARKIAILGDMLELGNEAPKFHADLAPLCAKLDGVICVGELAKNLYDALPKKLQMQYIAQPENANPAEIAKLLQSGDSVLIKGSKKIFYVHDFANNLIAVLK